MQLSEIKCIKFESDLYEFIIFYIIAWQELKLFHNLEVENSLAIMLNTRFESRPVKSIKHCDM